MNTRKLGSLQVSPLCLGCNVFGWTIDEPASFRILDAFVDAGLNFIDTADIYSRWKPGNVGGESETIIGNWFAQSGKRDKVVLATKCGMEMGADKKGLSRTYILAAIEDSLRRLKTDRIDLYQSHQDDPTTPQEETMRAFDHLVKQGKVRVVGASNISAKRLASAVLISQQHGLVSYQCLQPHYNLMERTEFENTMETLCLKEKIGVISYFSLAKGFLTGKYRTEADLAKSVRGGGVKPYMNDRGRRVLAALDEISATHKSTPAAVSLAWLIDRPSVTAPIASATTIEQLNDLIASTKLNLSASEIDQLNRASAS